MNDKVRYRMCAGCRKRMHQNELLRICKVNDKVLTDKSGKLGGRGAYICSESCLKIAEKGKQLNKILKTNVTAEIYAELYGEFENAKQ
ncbi:MAG: YlxR family protein [Clostridia bacterium]|nr:YlxR family protein [Clostridia bacterium]